MDQLSLTHNEAEACACGTVVATPEQIRVVGCWAHARRKFDESLQVLSPEARKDSQAAVGECYCSKLFHIEQQLAALTPEQRYSKRLEQEKPVLGALLACANELMPRTAGKSALGKALHYFLEDAPGKYAAPLSLTIKYGALVVRYAHFRHFAT